MFRNHILSRTACHAVLCMLLVWINIRELRVLDCYAASSGNSLPTFWDNRSHLQGSDRFPEMTGNTTTRCVIDQKSAVIICFAAEA